MDNIPQSVKITVAAAAKDISAAIKGACGKPGPDVNKACASMEKFMLGIVAGVYPEVKSHCADVDAQYSGWLDRSAADPAGNKIVEDKRQSEQWVAEHATKEMYEALIGGVASLANVLRQQRDNDTKGTFPGSYPGFPGTPTAPADPLSDAADKMGVGALTAEPAATDKPMGTKPRSLDELMALGDDELDKETSGDDEGLSHEKDEEPEEVAAEKAARPGKMNNNKVNEFNTSVEDAPSLPKGGVTL